MKEIILLRLKAICVCLSLIGIACIFYTLAMIFIILTTQEHAWVGGITYLLPLNLFGFVVVPYLISSKLYAISYNKIRFNIIHFIFPFVPLVAIFTYGFDQTFSNSIHNLIVAISEEFLCRFLIFNILYTKFSFRSAIIITSVLFGIVLHLESGILNDLIVKVPVGIILQLIYCKWGMELPIILHWLNNSVVNILA